MDTFANPTDAAAHFATRLTLYTDVSDVHAALETGQPGFVLVDTRSTEAWEQAHIPGAVHGAGGLDRGVPVVTYCWGPGCDGAARAALALARKGFQVKEMIGGIEYWQREGFEVRTPGGLTSRSPDPMTACGC